MQPKSNEITFGAIAAAVIIVLGIFAFSGGTNSTVEPSINDSKSLLTLYTNTTANVRACASSSCEVVGTYPPNEEIPVPSGISTFSQVPEWVSFSYPENDGSTATGYINKSVLSSGKTEVAETVSVSSDMEVSSAQVPKVADNLTTNSPPCLAIAQDAAVSGELQGLGEDVVVKQSHFKNGACYYELSYDYDTGIGRMTSTMIHAAPNSTIVAYCGYNHTTGATNCYDNNMNEIALSVFRLIEANLLTN